MVPLYSVSAILSFVFVGHAVLISIIRDIYEGYVVYNFFQLFLEYFGANEVDRLIKLQESEDFKMPPPWFLIIDKVLFLLLSSIAFIFVIV